MEESEKLDKTQLQSVAAGVIGEIVIALSRLEFNMSLYLRNAVGGTDVEAVNPLITRLSFKSKIDALQEVVEHKFTANHLCISEFMLWYKTIDKYRIKRNSFVHGRWAMYSTGQQAINVSPVLPNSKPQKENRYTVVELEKELAEVNQLVASFNIWSDKWPLYKVNSTTKCDS